MFSIIAPMDTNRLEQFLHTKRAYDESPIEKEFLIPTRSYLEVMTYLEKHQLLKDVNLIPYEHERGFNPSMALNLGLSNAKYENIIVTSPEVKPLTDVLGQLSGYKGKNVICQTFDQDADGNLNVLVCKGYRDKTPAMYFLAMFQKKDIEAINGWDEDFMLGYAYEDNDFGERWKRAGLPFKVVDHIKALHQYHPRGETIKGGSNINFAKFNENNDKGVIRCEHGMDKSPLL